VVSAVQLLGKRTSKDRNLGDWGPGTQGTPRIPSTVAVTWAGGSTNFGVISTEAQTKKRAMHRDGTML
jgi:hypothetical protein